MAIVKSNIVLIYKVTSTCLNEDGTVDITLATGYESDGAFVRTGVKKFVAPKNDVDLVLDVAPNGATRRIDIGNAIYNYLLSKGYVSGEIV